MGVTGSTHEGYYLSPVAASDAPPIGFEGKRASFADLPKAYVYDSLGNLLTGLGDQFSYNAENNRLLSAIVDNVQVDYTYDAAGFATSRGGVSLTWTAGGRLASYGSSTSLQWDVLGRQISSTVGGQQIRWRFGGLVQADSTGNPTAIELGEVQIQLPGGHLYRHMDFRGNVKFVTNDAAQVVAHYEYGPYGIANVLGSSADPVGFAGQRQIGSLMILGLRIYDPLVGRFLSPDPILDLVNQYDYAHGNPIWFRDPTGAQEEVDTVTFNMSGADWFSGMTTYPPTFLSDVADMLEVGAEAWAIYATKGKARAAAIAALLSSLLHQFAGHGSSGPSGSSTGGSPGPSLGSGGFAAPSGSGPPGGGGGGAGPSRGGRPTVSVVGDGYVVVSCSPTSVVVSRPSQLRRAAVILGSLEILLAAILVRGRRRPGR
jgi:RHS repeat-associated protein